MAGRRIIGGDGAVAVVLLECTRIIREGQIGGGRAVISIMASSILPSEKTTTRGKTERMDTRVIQQAIQRQSRTSGRDAVTSHAVKIMPLQDNNIGIKRRRIDNAPNPSLDIDTIATKRTRGRKRRPAETIENPESITGKPPPQENNKKNGNDDVPNPHQHDVPDPPNTTNTTSLLRITTKISQRSSSVRSPRES